jgi:hypothetical protein
MVSKIMNNNVDVFHCEQRTSEWFKLKCGTPSASNFQAIIKKLKNGNYSSERRKYLYKIVAERISDECVSSYFSVDMERGVELEKEAKSLYELTMDVSVDVEVGFMMVDRWGYSPDGLIGDDGLIEIKCPRLENHLETLDLGEMPDCYQAQVQGGLLISGRVWCDFISYAQKMPIFIKRIYRDEEYINDLKKELELFCDDANELYNRIIKRYQAN